MKSNLTVRAERMNERAFIHGLQCKRAMMRNGKKLKRFTIRVTVKGSGKVVGYIEILKTKSKIELVNGFVTDGMEITMRLLAEVRASDAAWDITSEGRIAANKKKEKAKTKALKKKGKREWKEKMEKRSYEVWRLSVGSKQELVKEFVSMHAQDERAAELRAAKSNRLSTKAIYIVQRFVKL